MRDAAVSLAGPHMHLFMATHDSHDYPCGKTLRAHMTRGGVRAEVAKVVLRALAHK